MNHAHFILFCALALMVGCAQDQKNTDTSSQPAQTESTHSERHDAQLGLNNGAKWEVNPEMMVYVAASEALVQSFDPSAAGAYEALATNLSENKDKLISSCTMKGASHDALHLWLEPYMGLLSQLKKAGTDEERAAVVDSIETSFETFHTFFQ